MTESLNFSLSQISRLRSKAKQARQKARLTELTSCFKSMYDFPLQQLFDDKGVTFEKYFLDTCRKYSISKSIDLVTFLAVATSDDRRCRKPKYSNEADRKNAKAVGDRKASLKKRLSIQAKTRLLIEQIDCLSSFLSNDFILTNRAGE